MPDIMHLIKIQSAPDAVYQAISTANGVSNWWTRDVDLDSHVGGLGEFRFYGGLVTRVRIAELASPARVVWKTLSSFRPEWSGTTISFDVREEDDSTILLFTHRDFMRADEIYAMTTTGWGYYLVSLQQYLETGQGAPSPDVEFARMLRAT